jgi:hypothetical protein
MTPKLAQNIRAFPSLLQDTRAALTSALALNVDSPRCRNLSGVRGRADSSRTPGAGPRKRDPTAKQRDGNGRKRKTSDI